MSDQPVHLSASGPPETIIPPISADLRQRLDQALATPQQDRRRAVSKVVADNPTFLEGWANIGDLSEQGIDAYMAYRVGYHRGLDTLRTNSWRGSGYVRWARESNRGFLRCLAGLAKHARIIGEMSEAIRCDQFLLQLDPSGEASK